MRNDAYKQIADGLRIMASGYDILAKNEICREKLEEKDSIKAQKIKSEEFKEIVFDENTLNKTNNKEKSVALADVRTAMAEKSKLGYVNEMKNILKDFGLNKLSEAKETNYKAILEAVNKIN